jgi:DNA-directed RNA polymerase specialized sigma24 family protein
MSRFPSLGVFTYEESGKAPGIVDDLIRDVTKAKQGDLEACGRLVQNTQAMVYGVAFTILRDATLAQDAAQESYLRAFRHLSELSEPPAFMGRLRRVAMTVAMNMLMRRHTLLRLDDVPEVPILDETEAEWFASDYSVSSGTGGPLEHTPTGWHAGGL